MSKPSAAKDPATRSGTAHLVAVPRLWLLLLTFLSVAPWLVFAVYVASQGAAASVPAEQQPAAAVAGPNGPWGELEIVPITISPPLEYVPRAWGPIQPSAWTFRAATSRQVATFLESAGMPAAAAERLIATARPTPEVGGVTVVPDDALVRGLPPDVRARIYLRLGEDAAGYINSPTPINFDQVTAYRYCADSVDEWLGVGFISPATRALVEPYVYRYDGFLYFADIERVRGQIADPEDLQRLAKRLLRQETMLVRVRVEDPAQVDAVTEYWGRGGRRTDIRPILESIARRSTPASDPSAWIDMSHLLPLLPRQLLYRYPKVTAEDLQRPLLANCLWTALNFFGDEPDPRYLDVAFALSHLKSDYFLVNDNYQLGDIVAFADSEGNLVHVAVHLAGDLVFSKNGTTSLAPWSIMPLSQLNGHYSEYSSSWRVSYHRRNDL